METTEVKAEEKKPEVKKAEEKNDGPKVYNVSSSPHVRDRSSTKSIMRDVVIALLPAAGVGIWNFRLSAVLVILTCCVSCVLAEWIWQKCMKQPVTTGDFSALLTGLLLALNMPATVPLWMCVIGSVFAIIVAKQIFGGLGQNFMNPALAGRCFMVLSFSSAMTAFTIKEGADWMYGIAVDATSSATPLMQVKTGMLPSLKDMFIGTTTGTIGETSVIALLIGAAYLLIRRVISWEIPVIYILSFAAIDLIYEYAVGGNPYPIFYEVCGGGLMLGAWFMATDYVTSPITKKGKIIYAILLGLLTALFRFFGESAEGVSFAIIIGNICVPLIERFTIPKAFGLEKKAKEGA
ncbi:MAG: RnfABCDGE type electron transport complex subunit D [Eubacterium sp.]|nr:RnfABCDGE type electron transport complex subunit D [Eubacterium sp.]